MGSELLPGNESGGLTEDGSTRTGIQFRVGGDRERLNGSVGKYPPQLDVAAPLGVGREAEPAENSNDLRARQAAELLGMRWRQLHGHDDGRMRREAESGEILTL